MKTNKQSTETIGHSRRVLGTCIVLIAIVSQFATCGSEKERVLRPLIPQNSSVRTSLVGVSEEDAQTDRNSLDDFDGLYLAGPDLDGPYLDGLIRWLNFDDPFAKLLPSVCVSCVFIDLSPN